MESISQEKKNIVILGAGFGGMRLALLLDRKLKKHKLWKKYEVALIDRNDYHTYTPTLYEVATTPRETSVDINLHSIVTFPIDRHLLGTNVEFLNSEVTKIDLNFGEVATASKTLNFDYLVIALGSVPNFFKIAGLKKFSIPLKTFSDAMSIRDSLLKVIDSKATPQIVVGGAGSTGIEIAGEIKNAFPQTSVTIIEGSLSILPGFDATTIQKVGERLHQMNIATILGKHIKKVQKNIITLSDKEETTFDVLIWAGGVKAPEIISTLPIKIEEKGRAEVIDEMECLPETPNLKMHGQVYALGDAVCFHDQKTSLPIPGVAQAAIAQADVVAENIFRSIMSREGRLRNIRMISYAPKQFPYIIPVGGKFAVAKVGRFVISDKYGWILKMIVELKYFISIMPIRMALETWVRGIRIFIKNDRLG